MPHTTVPLGQERSGLDSPEVPLFSSFASNYQFLGANPKEFRRHSFVQGRRGNARVSLIGRPGHSPPKRGLPAGPPGNLPLIGERAVRTPTAAVRVKIQPPPPPHQQQDCPPPPRQPQQDWADPFLSWRPCGNQQPAPPRSAGCLSVFVGSSLPHLPVRPPAAPRPQATSRHVRIPEEGLLGDGGLDADTAQQQSVEPSSPACQGGSVSGSPTPSGQQFGDADVQAPGQAQHSPCQATSPSKVISHWLCHPLHPVRSRRRTLQLQELPCEFPVIPVPV